MRIAHSPSKLQRYVPILGWARSYNRGALTEDMLAAVIVTIMLIPQSLAYALLAGLPMEVGLYASILPLVAYAIFGTSRALAVGPVAVVSLMTAAAIGNLNITDPQEYAGAAIILAFLSGGMLVLLGIARLGFVANFLSHPVISGFITASGLIIAASQLKHIFGISAGGANMLDIAVSLFQNLGDINLITTFIGGSAAVFLFWVRGGLKPMLVRLGLKDRTAGLVSKAGPVVVVIATTVATYMLDLEAAGVAIVGTVPSSLPPFSVPQFDQALWLDLLGPALLISVIGFVESVSVAQTLAAKRRQRIVPDQELIGLGAANLSSAFSGGYPVTGGFARSVVNFDAGAATPAAGAFTAVGILAATVFLTPLLYFLPKATLAATILIAVLSLVDFSILKKTWIYSKVDFIAVAATIGFTLILGIEVGVTTGVLLSIAMFLFKASRPHVAEVGKVPGTEHYRNILRHDVETVAGVVALRVDESLFFANARYLEDYIFDRVAPDEIVHHVVLQCSAVNEVDFSAVESLEAVNERLVTLGIKFHLSEVKGPVMDRLRRSHFLQELSGNVFLSHHQAMCELENRADESDENVVAPSHDDLDPVPFETPSPSQKDAVSSTGP